jgi:hypothetical protein
MLYTLYYILYTYFLPTLYILNNCCLAENQTVKHKSVLLALGEQKSLGLYAYLGKERIRLAQAKDQ